jgi:purine-binding chemotaxis protein CheW
MATSSSSQGKAAMTSGDAMQFCTFRVADRLYGTDIIKVKEITGETSFTPVFHAPPEVRGLVNIRGQINLVVDLRMLLGFEPAEVSASTRVVLFKPDVGEAFGLLVDSVGDVVPASESMIEWRREGAPAPVHGGVCERLETGVCKLDKALLVIIDPAMALPSLQSRTQS